jgi:hypothetical protein
MPACDILHGDKGYDSVAIRRQVEDGGATQHSAESQPQMEELLLAVPI